MKQLSLKAGEELLQENSTSDYMYFVIEGEIEIYVTLNGERNVLAHCPKGDEFGELGLLLQTKRTANAVAVKDTKLVAIDHDELMQKVQTDPQFAVRLVKKLAKKISDANYTIKEQISVRRSLEITYGHLMKNDD
ncbi:MAG: cyclic nucleotide-binding domain-containing protein [Spirochaetaceae bacterium]|nr:MAG: cyclic nucleotide-binding domain-containing protein [Spirochaetaceae bacterium]